MASCSWWVRPVAPVPSSSDCLKCLSAGSTGADSWITAGYDNCVKLWDARSPQKPALSVDHGAPVETFVAFPSAALVASGGGTALKLWDLVMGRSLAEADAHSKVVMGLALDPKASTLLTASFDSYVKAFRAADLSQLYSFKHAMPCTSVAWRPQRSTSTAGADGFVVGMDDGSWLFRSQESKKSLGKREEGFLRGEKHLPQPGDQVVEQPTWQPTRTLHPKKKEWKVNYFFRKFEYKKIGEPTGARPQDLRMGLGIVEALLEQGALVTALHERDEEFCLMGLKPWLHGSVRGLTHA
eukprot:g31346.t1